MNIIPDTMVTLVMDSTVPPALEVDFLPQPSLQFTMVPPAVCNITVLSLPVLNVSLGTAPVQGPAGPPGPRGSLFLGGYPSFANLPVPDGVNVKVGDFALVQDESAIYELE
jgi:hypothetical protein